MKLILTRHGKTSGNADGIIQDQLEGHLSEEGILQARKLALRLSIESIDHIYSSDAIRAKETTKEISALLPNVQVSFTPALRERHFGEFVGVKKSTLTVDTPYLESNKGEFLEDLYSRVKEFIEEVVCSHRESTVLFVAHGLTNKAIYAVLIGQSPDSVKTMDHFGNTSVSIFEVAQDLTTETMLLNCMKHLEIS